MQIYNLIAQRDAVAGMRLAEESAEIARQSQKAAEAALRESSSMKTIAVLTLIFLPPTFLCVSAAALPFSSPLTIVNSRSSA